MPKHATFVERFWEKVQIGRPDDCWQWLGAVKVPQGYGVINVPGARRQLFAHRVSALVHFGMIGRRDLVCHTCDNRRCVNPAHLYLGDERTNGADMMARGRGSGQFTRRTHCQRGHEFTQDNIYVTPSGSRSCYTCKRARWIARGSGAR